MIEGNVCYIVIQKSQNHLAGRHSPNKKPIVNYSLL